MAKPPPRYSTDWAVEGDIGLVNELDVSSTGKAIVGIVKRDKLLPSEVISPAQSWGQMVSCTTAVMKSDKL